MRDGLLPRAGWYRPGQTRFDRKEAGMASISTSIELVDRVSGRLAVIEAGALALCGAFEQLDAAIGAAEAGLAGFSAAGMPEGGRMEIEARIIPKLDTAGIRDGMAEGQAGIAAQVQAMLDGAAAAYRGDGMQRLGRQVPERLIAGMEEGAGRLESRMREICAGGVQAAGEAMNAAAGRRIGMNFSSGLAAGISAGRSGVVKAARAVANAAAGAARAALDIHSPSRVMKEAGGYFGEGFSIGIEESARAVQDAAARLAGCAQAAAAQVMGEGVGRGSALGRGYGQPYDGEGLRLVRETVQEGGMNRPTTAQVHVDFTANNRIDSRMDLDEVIAYLEQQLTERLAMAAEGVYA